MALKKTITTKHVLEVKDAYHRVEEVSIEHKNRVKFCVKSYADPSKDAISEKWYNAEYSLEKTNPIAQAYDHLKTLSEFIGAVDC